MELNVKLDDGRTLTVTPVTKDLVQFERRYDMPAGALEANPRIEYVMFLAWTALVRTKQLDIDFEAFLDRVDAMEEPTAHPLPPPA